jgi:hypothetical protein
MPDLVVVAANVKATATGLAKQQANAGEVIAAGDVVYLETVAPNAGKWLLADANVAAKARIGGVALNGAALDQPVTAATQGEIDLGVALAVGRIYVLSGNPGKIAPSTDLITGWTTCILGVATAANKLKLSILNSSAVVA